MAQFLYVRYSGLSRVVALNRYVRDPVSVGTFYSGLSRVVALNRHVRVPVSVDALQYTIESCGTETISTWHSFGRYVTVDYRVLWY